LETLQHYLPSNVRHTLEEFLESLNETFERIPKETKKPNRAHAHRLLQCLVVAIRSLRVEELAEILAADFGDEETGIEVEPELALEGSRTSTSELMLQFNRHCGA
jgi:hypothetical protein